MWQSRFYIYTLTARQVPIFYKVFVFKVDALHCCQSLTSALVFPDRAEKTEVLSDDLLQVNSPSLTFHDCHLTFKEKSYVKAQVESHQRSFLRHIFYTNKRQKLSKDMEVTVKAFLLCLCWLEVRWWVCCWGLGALETVRSLLAEVCE